MAQSQWALSFLAVYVSLSQQCQVLPFEHWSPLVTVEMPGLGNQCKRAFFIGIWIYLHVNPYVYMYVNIYEYMCICTCTYMSMFFVHSFIVLAKSSCTHSVWVVHSVPESMGSIVSSHVILSASSARDSPLNTGHRWSHSRCQGLATIVRAREASGDSSNLTPNNSTPLPTSLGCKALGVFCI